MAMSNDFILTGTRPGAVFVVRNQNHHSTAITSHQAQVIDGVEQSIDDIGSTPGLNRADTICDPLAICRQVFQSLHVTCKREETNLVAAFELVQSPIGGLAQFVHVRSHAATSIHH